MKVTVITPTWKRDPQIVDRCLGCVEYQTHADWEQLVCSDGEAEEPIKSIVEKRRDDRRHYHFLGPEYNDKWDSGNTVRQKMIDRASGDYICFYDDDNIIMPYYIERMLNALEQNTDADFAVCRILHFGPLRLDVGKPPCVLTGVPPKLYRIDSLQVLVETEAIRDIGWIQDDGPYYADGTTYQALAAKYKYIEVPEILGIHI